MVIYRSPPSLPSDLTPANQGYRPMAEVIWKKAEGQTHRSDKNLLDSGYMCDCKVICRNSNWATHKAILCSRNNWFRAALTGGFQEALTGVVTIEDTSPDAMQIVLDVIYTGGIHCCCSTAADIVELWKASNVFGIQVLREEAENAMFRRLEASVEFFAFNPKPKTSPRAEKGCNTVTVVHDLVYDLYNHIERETRVCPVSSSQGNEVFRVCEPHVFDHRPNLCDFCGDLCETCQKLLRNMALSDDVHNQMIDVADEHSRRYEPRPTSTRPEGRTRELVESEIQELCEALNIALAKTPKESRIHTMLLDHMCKTPVEPWGGVELCRFLERHSPVA